MPKVVNQEGNSALVAVSCQAGDVRDVCVLGCRQARFCFLNALFGGLDFRAAILSDADTFLARRNGRAGVELSASRYQVRVQRQAQQVVERNRQIVDLQAAASRAACWASRAEARLSRATSSSASPLSTSLRLSCSLTWLAATCFPRSLLFELRDEDAVVELANLERNLILGLIYLRPRALDISSRGAIGFANLETSASPVVRDRCRWCSW